MITAKRESGYRLACNLPKMPNVCLSREINKRDGKSGCPRILMLADSSRIFSKLGQLLQSKGYQVELTSNAGVSLEELDKNTFDLLILSITREQLDRLPVLKKAKEIGSPTKVMVLSPSHEKTLPLEVYQIGVDDYLFAPFTPSELCRRVSNCLRESRVKQREARAISRSDLINAEIFNSLRLKFQEIHNSLIAILAHLKNLSHSEREPTDEWKPEKRDEILTEVFKLMRISEAFLYNTFLCQEGIDG